ncbi:MAG TPA: branched chain amino acid aminotransferase, partial [Candidatus Aminicenantes bacterium]|nr:branched chain amino acid aminotransferase [Candidatus Aminicenantes bacterium]
MTIKQTLLPPEKLKPLFADPLKLQFGRTFTDYMFTMSWHPEQGWHSPEIKPYGPLMLDPSASVLHYSQEVFEGQKAYLSADRRILLFRPRENARRMNRSLHRLCMPEIPEGDFLAAEQALLTLEKRWIP